MTETLFNHKNEKLDKNMIKKYLINYNNGEITSPPYATRTTI